MQNMGTLSPVITELYNPEKISKSISMKESRWFETLNVSFVIYSIFSYVKPISLLVTLIPKKICLTRYNKNGKFCNSFH